MFSFYIVIIIDNFSLDSDIPSNGNVVKSINLLFILFSLYLMQQVAEGVMYLNGPSVSQRVLHSIIQSVNQLVMYLISHF